MCGIIGFLSKEKDCRVLLKKFVHGIKDRGVTLDAFFSKNESYGYARLPTDGVNKKSLNAIQHENGVSILFNGLITNVDDLCTMFDLSQQAKESDTQCLLIGFTKYGETFLAKCRGMFAFAFISKDEVVLVRDTVGIKPLYFENSADIFAFSSEIKGLPALAKAQEILPGQIVTYNKKTKEISFSNFLYKSYKNFTKNQLLECLTESIVVPTQRYVQQTKNKKIGILLSGGVDSSLVAKILVDNIAKDEKKRLIVFCVGEKTSKDTIIARKLAKELEIKLEIVEPYSARESLKKLKQVIEKVESKHARVIKVALLQEVLAERIKSFDIDILISGEGADELFFGYKRFIEGLLPSQTEKLFNIFYSKVFYYTLLQRYERIFARSQIEGRVPFLDQELIELSKQFSPQEKIYYFGNSFIVKVPLRKLAQKIGLPPYIYQREKEKMTHGATGQDNEQNSNGYLEKEAQQITGKTFTGLVEEYYKSLFPLQIPEYKSVVTEDQLMERVGMYKKSNNFFREGVSI